MKFGAATGRQLSGADVYVNVFQAVSLLPLPYMLVVSGYAGLVTRRNVLSFLFDAGCAALPRAQTLALSFLYGIFPHELVLYFSLPLLALVFGLVIKKLLRGSRKTAKTVRIVLCAAVAADLILRIFTPLFHIVFGWSAALIGLAVRLACLALVAGDLIAEKKTRGTAQKNSQKLL